LTTTRRKTQTKWRRGKKRAAPSEPDDNDRRREFAQPPPPPPAAPAPAARALPTHQEREIEDVPITIAAIHAIKVKDSGEHQTNGIYVKVNGAMVCGAPVFVHQYFWQYSITFRVFPERGWHIVRSEHTVACRYDWFLNAYVNQQLHNEVPLYRYDRWDSVHLLLLVHGAF
jgi:hypothetical protein